MPLPGQIASSPLDLIGNTPVVRFNHMVREGAAQVLGKLESQNPGGSVKDRICLAMIDAAERSGRLRPGGTIVEPTSGNTGIGLAMIAAAKGYRLILTMPDTMSEERRSLLRAYGAELILTPDSKGMHDAIRKAEEIVQENPGFFMPGQFTNAQNPEAHRQTTGPEILRQCPGLDVFVAGVGTGGTISGVGAVLKASNPDIRIVAIEPSASAVLSGGEPGFHGIQGIGAGFIPENLDRSVIDQVVQVSDDDAIATTRRLAREEGILTGVSAGAAAYAAIQIAEGLGTDQTVLCILCDTGERYLSSDVFDRGAGM